MPQIVPICILRSMSIFPRPFFLHPIFSYEFPRCTRVSHGLCPALYTCFLLYTIENQETLHLSVILRYFQIIPLPTDIIRIGKFRIFSVEYRTQSTHITIRNASEGIFYILSSLFFRRMFYLRRSHILTTYLTSPIFFLYSSLISRNSFSPLIYGS